MQQTTESRSRGAEVGVSAACKDGAADSRSLHTPEVSIVPGGRLVFKNRRARHAQVSSDRLTIV